MPTLDFLLPLLEFFHFINAVHLLRLNESLVLNESLEVCGKSGWDVWLSTRFTINYSVCIWLASVKKRVAALLFLLRKSRTDFDQKIYFKRLLHLNKSSIAN